MKLDWRATLYFLNSVVENRWFWYSVTIVLLTCAFVKPAATFELLFRLLLTGLLFACLYGTWVIGR